MHNHGSIPMGDDDGAPTSWGDGVDGETRESTQQPGSHSWADNSPEHNWVGNSRLGEHLGMGLPYQKFRLD